MPNVKRSAYSTFERPFSYDNLEEVACDFCGSEDYSKVAEESGFDIRKCAQCGLVYVSPQPSLEEFHEICEGMYPDASATAIEGRSLGMHEPYLRAIVQRRKPEGGRLLDVGCGFGLFLKAMSGLPWALQGIELSPTAAAHAREYVPEAVIHQSRIEDAPIAPASQDCVTCIAVFEHVRNPSDILERFTRWLAPGGLLLLHVPYVTGFVRARRFLPFLPTYFEAPNHLYDYPPQLLAGRLKELGFADVRLNIPPPYSSPNPLVTSGIWAVKLVGRMLQAATGGQYIYPFAGSYCVHAIKRESAAQ